jgi:hypothetical protein
LTGHCLSTRRARVGSDTRAVIEITQGNSLVKNGEPENQFSESTQREPDSVSRESECHVSKSI